MFRAWLGPVILGLAMLAVLQCPVPASASVITHTPYVYTGSPVTAAVQFRDGADSAGGAGTVEVRISVTPGTADIRGFFGNIADDSFLAGLFIQTNPLVTDFDKLAGGIDDTGGGNNINPEGPFDFGVEIGTPGIGSDDVSFISFVFDHPTAPLTNADFLTVTDPVTPSGPNQLFFALRLTSVLEGGSRDGSSKLGGDIGTGDNGDPDPPPPGPSEIPEPSTLVLGGICSVAGLLGFVRRRRFSAR